ncbi:Sterol 24-C-methyltransferase [Mycena sanguinolenta]|uniref:Sterol 24-C-methyltransferase n=1 Tax=Mycena sanguinolenta TaxID=230812 RepID=A0A8H7DHL8_9AGAR|nr:Sterol 24-C-methyltransferase [Mycena sanguinolenta]
MFRPRFGSTHEDNYFTRIFKGDALKDAFSRHRTFLFSQLVLRPGMHVLHVACGTGTTSLELAFLSNVHVIGIDGDSAKIYQAQRKAQEDRMTHLVAFIHVPDITKVDEIFPPFSFDAAFAIEVLNFLPSFSAIYRPLSTIIRPGGSFASYEWCWTARLNPQDPEHRRLVRSIEDSFPIVRRQPSHRTMEAAASALLENQFQVIQAEDLANRKSTATLPWYSDLQSALSERHYFSRWMDTEERGGLTKQAAALLLEAGRHGLFTPMALLVAQRV